MSAASAAPSNIDPDEPRSLTIHKLSQPATSGAAGDGSEVPSDSLPAGALPIDGVTFTVREVTEIGGVAVDLETDAGWALIQPYLANPGSFTTAGNTLVPAGTGVTGAAGVPGELVFDSLNVGLFYVKETDAPANVSTRAGTKYWVVETKAPAGYVAAAAPTEITVYPGTGLTGSGSVANVPNQMREAGALPVLGGAGMTAIGIAGAILITGGVLFAIFGRRKQTDTTTASA